MANNVTVKWMQVSNFKLANGGTGIGDGVTYTSLLNDATKKNVLNFGNVQAGKITNIKCVVARFGGASQVSDLQFWLDSTDANATGSTNTQLTENNGWNFYYCIVPQNKLNFNIDTTTFTDAQKKGVTTDGKVAYLDDKNTFYMRQIEKNVDEVPVNQFPAPTTENQQASLVIEIPSGEERDSYLIMLDVQTPTNANSGNTEGWYYRMNFLYS